MNKETEIEKVSKREVLNETDDINKFISELKTTGASLIETFKILASKLNINTDLAYDMTRNSPAWSHIFNVDNPFTQEFLDLASEDADEVEIKDSKLVSITYKLENDSKID
ncbi:hypothetical protein K8089_12075 [Aequorivita sp. F47161]|uniref:Uncharacterized protein n=1 Tax=Aequorivita vitellina TaxID=2874475 RepID=A0A9X1U400_9FLAO|nr:hypothetical protein [Aequorivita vitellina]MCG2419762.1 hypothetical protein [Aequorivita vitellina]